MAVHLSAKAAKFELQPLVTAYLPTGPGHRPYLHRQAQGDDRHHTVDRHYDDNSTRRMGTVRKLAVLDVHTVVTR